jgi:hypothetical protein
VTVHGKCYAISDGDRAGDPYKIETKDIGIQVYWAVLHLGVGYRAMV